jgi:uncharacterized OB-fold protein
MKNSIIRQYYDALGEGRLLAHRCARCKGYTFPPTTACEHCGSEEYEAMTLSGRGKLHYASHGMLPPSNPRFSELAPFVYGHIILEEGVVVQAIVNDVEPTPRALADLFEAGPVDVVPDIIKVQELNVLAFRLGGEIR